MSKKKTKAELLLDDILLNTHKYEKVIDENGNIVYVLKKEYV